MSSSQQSQGMRTTPQCIPTCSHGAVRRTSHSLRNPNRDFWCCRLSQSNEGCKYFIWADQVPDGTSSSTPSTIQHPPQSPMSKRLRDIEKGLQERHENRIVTADHSSTAGEELPVQQALPPSLTSGSSSSTNQERELPPSPPKQVPRRSFLGLDSPVMTPAEVPAVPDSPPSQNRSSGLGSSMLLTPPKTVHRSTSGFVFVDVGEPISPTANKGKGRAVDDSIGGSTENEFR
ncbi:hypothetical protein EDD17DRAFT_12658 [Pisolithus thermaeus]|nr:hypothetical protein EDD17DRAFT_12658 [Pisolithus thermaeus]